MASRIKITQPNTTHTVQRMPLPISHTPQRLEAPRCALPFLECLSPGFPSLPQLLLSLLQLPRARCSPPKTHMLCKAFLCPLTKARLGVPSRLPLYPLHPPIKSPTTLSSNHLPPHSVTSSPWTETKPESGQPQPLVVSGLG